MRKITIKPLADNDLEEIWFYSYNKWSYEQANHYHREIMVGLQDIAKDISIGKQIDNIKLGYRRYKINHHYVIYKTIQSHIDIVRVLHEKMDTPKHLR